MRFVVVLSGGVMAGTLLSAAWYSFPGVSAPTWVVIFGSATIGALFGYILERWCEDEF